MNRVAIDGVEYEEIEDLSDFSSMNGDITLHLRPIAPKPKTIVQVAADAMGEDEKDYRRKDFVCVSIYDYIEQRLQAIEKKLELSDAGGKEWK